MDYGTGHELNFVVFLLGLECAGITQKSDRLALFCKLYVKYLEIVRKLQSIYKLEPAGSHGVWGLDDYQLISYLWGSAQFINHPSMRPKSILNPELVSSYQHEYIYLACIQFIQKMKSGPFHEHSPMLYGKIMIYNRYNWSI